MTPREKAILQLMATAEQVGLDPVVELPENSPPRSVDLRIIRDGQIVAAMRAYIENGVWWHQHPARPWGEPVHTWDIRYLGGLRQITPEDLRTLDHWWAKLPATGKEPVPRPPRRPEDASQWMTDPHFWQQRIRSGASA